MEGQRHVDETTLRAAGILKKLLVPVGCHDGVIGGNSGVLHTLKRVAAQVFWERMCWDIQWYVSACQTCQQNKSSSLALEGLL